ncbi:hypothetical protein RND71_038056 [Anisodus tanguticus]|uniref:Uncharacterized protein n=1 Tax=Anisodus tanguticus TaxID=243964 RepID=A0AAE1QZ00_9SOLA|nr:hypothetical protein RND71_038056 [Anisodus tanguticus]
MRCKVPSLVDLCVQTAVDNVRYLGDVGETDIHLLERILPHCTLEPLIHVENSTEIEFGEKSINQVVERMKQRKVTFKWKQLYEAKSKEVEETQQRSFERIKELYQKEDASSGPGSSFGNTKSSLMKKAKIEFVNR